MDNILNGFSNEELMLAIIENALIYIIEIQNVNLSKEDKMDIINSVLNYRNMELIDNIFQRVSVELENRELIPKEDSKI